MAHAAAAAVLMLVYYRLLSALAMVVVWETPHAGHKMQGCSGTAAIRWEGKKGLDLVGLVEAFWRSGA